MAACIALNWEFYEPRVHDRKSAVYLVANRDWGYGPRYIGEALVIKDRFDGRTKIAKQGGLTLFQPSFSASVDRRTPATFVTAWEAAVQDENTADLYVPGDPVKVSGLAYWQSAPKLIGVINREEIPSDKAAKTYLQTLESRTQQDAKNYYAKCAGDRKIDWRIPRSSSELFGQHLYKEKSPKIAFTIQYSLNGVSMPDADAFFVAVARALEQQLPSQQT